MTIHMIKRCISAITVIAIINALISTSVLAGVLTVTDTSKEYTNVIAEDELAKTVNYDTSIYNGDKGISFWKRLSADGERLFTVGFGYTRRRLRRR